MHQSVKEFFAHSINAPKGSAPEAVKSTGSIIKRTWERVWAAATEPFRGVGRTIYNKEKKGGILNLEGGLDKAGFGHNGILNIRNWARKAVARVVDFGGGVIEKTVGLVDPDAGRDVRSIISHTLNSVLGVITGDFSKYLRV